MKSVVETKDGILKALQDNRDALRALGVTRLALFGSFARGEQTPTSDVDALVEFEPGQKTFDHFIQLSFLLEDTFQRRVEVVTPDSLSPYLGKHILKEVLYVPVAA
jgi:predicted nucleotidyltransferase